MLTRDQKINVARARGMSNVSEIFDAADKAGVGYAVACALFEKESHGRNVYGNDDGGMLAGFPAAPNSYNYAAFRWMVMEQMHQSNGVGPAQITSRGLLQKMEDEGLKPYVIEDNMYFGLKLLKTYKEQTGSWENAGERYNGNLSYGMDLEEKIAVWRTRFDN